MIFDFRFWGQITKILEKSPDSSTRHWGTFRGQIWWKSAVAKWPKGRLDYHTEKLCLYGTRPSPHFVQNGPIVSKIPWTLSPLDMSTCTEFGPDRLRFAGICRNDWFFGPKSLYNVGFQPTNSVQHSSAKTIGEQGRRTSRKPFALIFLHSDQWQCH